MNAFKKSPDEVIQCPLCGFRFTQTEDSTCHASCPFAKGCNLICCPQCGYSFAEKSKTVEWLKGLFKRLKKETKE